MDAMVVLLKMNTGELVVGTLLPELSKTFETDYVYIQHPFTFMVTPKGMVMVKWNSFSGLNVVPVNGSAVVYTDIPNADMMKLYTQALCSLVSHPKEHKDYYSESQTTVIH